MFGNAEVIEASRKFVCVRIDTYESEEHEKLVRKLLDGVFVNTAFCLLSPDGKTELTRPGRAFSRAIENARDLNRVSGKYVSTGLATEAITPDFHSFRLALNIAAADGRILVLIAAPKDQVAAVEEHMRKVAWHPDVVGRFHFDFETNATKFKDRLRFQDGLDGSMPGVYCIQPGEFGLKGTVLGRVALDADKGAIRRALLNANEDFAKATKVKSYQPHVSAGRQKGIYFEMPVPYGEDRDADGKIDASHASRFQRARQRAKQTGNLVPID